MRRGYALIEMIVVITISALIFTATAMAIHTLSRTLTLVQTEAETGAALHELARRFRADAHAATEFSENASADGVQEPSSAALTFQFADGRHVVYDFNADVARVRRREVREEQTVRRDTFALPRGCTVDWRTPDEDSDPLLAIVISRPVGQEPNERRARKTTRIEAVLGLEHRVIP